MTSIDHYLSSSLWHNSLTKIDNIPVFHKSWYAKGVKNVAHLMKDSTTFLCYLEFEKLFGFKSSTIFISSFGFNLSKSLISRSLLLGKMEIMSRVEPFDHVLTNIFRGHRSTWFRLLTSRLVASQTLTPL